MRALLKKLPVRFRDCVGAEDMEGLEEIRLRAGRPMELDYGNAYCRRFGMVRKEDVEEMLNYLTGYSLYAYEEELRQGFFTISGGHRVGVVGHVSMEDRGDGKIAAIGEFGGLNIRIARERKGIALPLMERLREGDSIRNTLILSAPGEGKTTLLRDVIRILSDGADGRAPRKVSLADERSEIAACCHGIPQKDVGARTDVLDNCPKRQGMEMLLRSMSPQIIAADELGEEDIPVLERIFNCGCRLIGTVHAETIDELRERKGMQEILDQNWIKRFVVIRRGAEGQRDYQVYNENLCSLC